MCLCYLGVSRHLQLNISEHLTSHFSSRYFMIHNDNFLLLNPLQMTLVVATAAAVTLATITTPPMVTAVVLLGMTMITQEEEGLDRVKGTIST